MRLFRYLTITYLRHFAIVLLGLIVLYFIIDLVDQANIYYFKHKPDEAAFATYMLLRIPQNAVFMLPVAMLLGALTMLFSLGHNHELTAMRAGGIPIWRIAAPIYCVALVLAALHFILAEAIVPSAAAEMRRIREREIYGRQPVTTQHDLWFRVGRTHYRFGALFLNERLIEGLEVYRFDENFDLRERVSAELAVWDGKTSTWQVRDGLRMSYREESIVYQPFERIDVELTRFLDSLVEQQYDSAAHSRRDLRRTIADLERRGIDTARYRVDLHNKSAVIAIGPLMLLLAFAFGVQRVRAGGTALALILCLAVAFAYQGGSQLTLALGYEGRISPVLAAWLMNGVFLAITLPLTAIRLRRLNWI